MRGGPVCCAENNRNILFIMSDRTIGLRVSILHLLMTCTCSTFDSLVKIGVSVETSQWYGPAASKSIFFNCSCSSLEFFHCVNKKTEKKIDFSHSIEHIKKRCIFMQIDVRVFEVSSPKIAIRVLLGQPKINVIVFASIFISMKLYVMFYSTYIDFGAWNSEISIGRCSIFYKLEDFPRTITQPSDLELKKKQ